MSERESDEQEMSEGNQRSRNRVGNTKQFKIVTLSINQSNNKKCNAKINKK